MLIFHEKKKQKKKRQKNCRHQIDIYIKKDNISDMNKKQRKNNMYRSRNHMKLT